MKRLNCRRFLSIVKSSSTTHHHLGFDPIKHRRCFYFQEHCSYLLNTPVIPACNYSIKRTLTGNVKEEVGQESVGSSDADFDRLLSNNEPKEPTPCRRPAHAPSEHSKHLFTVSNVLPEKIKSDAENDALSKKKEKKAISLAIEARKANANEKSPFRILESEEFDPVKRAVKALTMPNLDYISDEDFARLIRRNVIYADKQFVIFNKPYGIPMHGGDKTSRHIKSILPMVSKMVYGVGTEIPLTICNRLDKFTTGICVTTTNETITSRILTLFREHKILKKYWAITLYPPDPSAGIIDIPLDRSIIESDKQYARMVVKPDVRYDPLTNKQVKVHSKGQIAITHYSTLDVNTLALVELQPFTTIKHQLRVHLADGLDCPILGDHKYSHIGKLAPQVLPQKVLKNFGIPHSKSRYTPLHLHLQSILIPDIFPGNKKPHLMVGAKMPFHMSRTMRMFRLKPGIPTKWKGVNNLWSTDRTAEPRDKTNELYVDPTVPKNSEKKPEVDINDKSVKIFRSNVRKVKYKHPH